MPTLIEVARCLRVDRSELRVWTTTFSEHLSPEAVSAAGEEPQYNEADLRVLAFVAEQIEAGAEPEEIADLLQGEGSSEARFVEFARLHTPLFRDVPDEIDEMWGHGSLIGGMAARQLAQVARSYKAAADELAGRALASQEPHELDYPVLFLYRHAIELYLKALLSDRPRTHNLGRLIDLLEGQYGGKLDGWIADHLRDFHEIDRKSDMFRYADSPSGGELWVDFHQLRAVLDRLVEVFGRALDPRGRAARAGRPGS